MYTVIEVSGKTDYADILHKIEMECFPQEYWSYDAILSEITKENTHFVIAYDCNKPIGYFCFSCLLGEAELERICVIPYYQRSGAGSQMLSYAIDYLRELNCSKFMLEVRSKNYKAVSLYKKYGFEVDFIRKKYYQNPVDDAILMTYTY